MVQREITAQDAVREAAECCDRITSVLLEAMCQAEQLGDGDMLARLTAATAAAQRGNELIGRLAAMLEIEH
jgi:hypothetical protein